MVPMRKSKERDKESRLKELTGFGIEYSTKDGVSFFTTNVPTPFEFWPTTGAWLNRATRERGKDFADLKSQLLSADGEPVADNRCYAPPAPVERAQKSKGDRCIKVNVNVDGRFFSVSSKRFAVTDASQMQGAREQLMRDIAAAIDAELQ